MGSHPAVAKGLLQKGLPGKEPSTIGGSLPLHMGCITTSGVLVAQLSPWGHFHRSFATIVGRRPTIVKSISLCGKAFWGIVWSLVASLILIETLESPAQLGLEG